MDIEEAGLEDLPKILELQKICYTENAERYGNYDIPPIQQTLSELEEEYNDSIILKAIEDNKLVGSIRACQKNGTCHVGRVVVHPDYQNQGIGSKLMNKIEEYFKVIKRFELFTGFKDEKNLYLYQKLGYKIFRKEQVAENLEMVFLEKEFG